MNMGNHTFPGAEPAPQGDPEDWQNLGMQLHFNFVADTRPGLFERLIGVMNSGRSIRKGDLEDSDLELLLKRSFLKGINYRGEMLYKLTPQGNDVLRARMREA